MDNMKKVPFSLELAKQGVAIFVGNLSHQPMTFLAEYNDKVWLKYNNGTSTICFKDNCYHLIPEEPVKERWAIISKNFIYESRESAEKDLGSSSINYVIVKLAE